MHLFPSELTMPIRCNFIDFDLPMWLIVIHGGGHGKSQRDTGSHKLVKNCANMRVKESHIDILWFFLIYS